MRSTRYYAQNDLYYSMVYGGGIYEWTGRLVQDPLGGGQTAEAVSLLLSSVLTGEQFFLRCIPDGSQRRYQKMVLSPPRGERILWPGDLVHLEEDICNLFVAQKYAHAREQAGADALLFPYGTYPRMIDAAQRLSQLDKPSWKAREVQSMAAEIARALEDLNRNGYLYMDIHLSRFYFTASGKVFLDFSDLIFPACGDCPASADHFPIEFADPSVIQGRIPHADIHSQDYSLCALLFFLFFGRYAYDGKLLADSHQQHDIKFRDYHKMPVFIFDPKDPRNGLGEFEDEKPVVALWEELPECLKGIFIQTLQKENAERSRPVNNPMPSTWLRCFKELGWCE